MQDGILDQNSEEKHNEDCEDDSNFCGVGQTSVTPKFTRHFVCV